LAWAVLVITVLVLVKMATEKVKRATTYCPLNEAQFRQLKFILLIS
jgi:hypothetical protein